MRKSLIGFVLLVFCGALGLYTFAVLLSSNKSFLLQHLEQRLGRKISAGQVRVTVIPGIGVHFNDLVMVDDPAFSRGVFVTANSLQVNVHFWPLLLQQLRIKKVILHDPLINIVRNQAGVYNFSSLGLQSTRNESVGAAESSRAPAEHAMPLLTSFSLIQVFNGRIRYLDQKDGSDLTVSHLDLKIAELNYENSFQLEMAMAVFAAKQNLQLKTAVGPLDSHSSLRDLPFDGELRADAIDMGRIRAALPVIKKELPRALDLRGVYTIKALRFKGTLNKPWLKGAVEGTDASFRFE
jgi:uncharacterized protein involved in outer membrane biogenesis